MADGNQKINIHFKVRENTKPPTYHKFEDNYKIYTPCAMYEGPMDARDMDFMKYELNIAIIIPEGFYGLIIPAKESCVKNVMMFGYYIHPKNDGWIELYIGFTKIVNIPKDFHFADLYIKKIPEHRFSESFEIVPRELTEKEKKEKEKKEKKEKEKNEKGTKKEEHELPLLSDPIYIPVKSAKKDD
jgi:hypothetical protein